MKKLSKLNNLVKVQPNVMSATVGGDGCCCSYWGEELPEQHHHPFYEDLCTDDWC